jgi:hypothetical protein
MQSTDQPRRSIRINQNAVLPESSLDISPIENPIEDSPIEEEGEEDSPI